MTAIQGFDIMEVDATSVTGAAYDPDTGKLTNITGNVTYQYTMRDAISGPMSDALAETFTISPQPIALDSTNFPDAEFLSYVAEN